MTKRTRTINVSAHKLEDIFDICEEPSYLLGRICGSEEKNIPLSTILNSSGLNKEYFNLFTNITNINFSFKEICLKTDCMWDEVYYNLKNEQTILEITEEHLFNMFKKHYSKKVVVVELIDVLNNNEIVEVCNYVGCNKEKEYELEKKIEKMSWKRIAKFAMDVLQLKLGKKNE